MEKRAKTAELIALIISIVLNPVLMVFAMLAALADYFTIPMSSLMLIMLPFLLTTLGYVAIKTYVLKDSDLDLSKLKSRKYLGLSAITGLIISYILSLYFYPQIVAVFYYSGVIILISGITSLFWKISFHAIGFSSFVFSFSRFFGLQWLLLLLLLPVLFWARIKLKKHTLSQLIAGTLLGLIFLL